MKNFFLYLSLLFILVSCGGGGGGGSSTSEPNPPVVNSPEINFSSSKSSVFVDEDFSLTWSSSYTTSCTASGDWTDSIETSGTSTQSFDTAGQYTFNISCTGSGGTSSKSLSVTVLDFITLGNLVFEVNQNASLESVLPVTNNTDESIEFSLNTDSINGSTVIEADGSFTYTPNTDYT